MSDPWSFYPITCTILSEHHKKKETLNYTQSNHDLQTVPSLVSTDSHQKWKISFTLEQENVVLSPSSGQKR